MGADETFGERTDRDTRRRKIKLAEFDPDGTHGVDKAAAADQLEKNLERLSVLQYLLYAEARRSLLVVLQGIDAGGKDGTIRHVMSGLNPQGVTVTSFKVAGWRREAPRLSLARAQGRAGIRPNRHLQPLALRRRPGRARPQPRAQIRLVASATTRSTISNACSPRAASRIVKFLLYISKEEQAKRFRQRIDDKAKNWKFSPDDLKEREYWDQYIEAYEDMLRKCSTETRPGT